MIAKWPMRCAVKRVARIRNDGRFSIFLASMRMGLPIRPVIIAHRGASGYLPEHTFPAKALAYTMGADYLEQDVVATFDDQLVVLHDIHLDRVTDVEKQFPGRDRKDGRFYVRDFTLEELRSLLVHERTDANAEPVYPARFNSGKEEFRIHTFSEELAFIASLQASVGRSVGVYPEIKRPEWHRNEGVDITPIFLDELREFGYNSHADPVYVQCFDDRELIRIRETYKSDLKLIQLIGGNDWGEGSTDYDELRTVHGLRRLSKTVNGIGPWVEHLYRQATSGQIDDSGLVSRAHNEGLAVHPYTFRRDDLPTGFASFEKLLRFAFDELSVDGLFTDFPDIAKAAITK
jgi:glycerophosphoryl diester phosphodiesterase